MKKNLAVRIGAIVTVLMVAFFSILPDLVSAEGDDTDSQTEEIVAEVADAETTDVSDAMEETPESAEDVTETEVTEPWPEVPADSEVSEEESKEDEPEDVTDSEEDMEPDYVPEDTEQNGDSNGEQAPVVTPEDTENNFDTPDTKQPLPEDTTEEQNPDYSEDYSEMDTMDDYLGFMDEKDLLNDENENLMHRLGAENDLEGLAEKFENNEEDFVIEGTTLVRYNGSDAYVAIPASVTIIGDGAFAGNTSLTAVAFPPNLQSIGSAAFSGCSNLMSVNIPDTVTSVGAGAFLNCSGLADVYTGTGAGTISANEFANCVSLQSVAIPEGISSIASGAFSGCSNLSSISLPSTMASIDFSAFSGDVNLASISVSSASYASYDGCIYTADGSQLLFCPQGKTGISFASGTRSIASGAFSGCNYLLSAVLPSAAGSIEANAFSGSAIKAVTIPASVTSIGSQSGWTPNVIYGYSGSTAEAWAHASNYVFESLDGTPGVSDNPKEEHIEDPDPTDGTDSTVARPGGSTPGVNLGSSGAGAGTTAAISRNAGNRTASTTPKTGVEDYSMYFLFGGIFLVGIAFLAYSRKLRIDGKEQ